MRVNRFRFNRAAYDIVSGNGTFFIDESNGHVIDGSKVYLSPRTSKDKNMQILREMGFISSSEFLEIKQEGVGADFFICKMIYREGQND